MNLMKFKGADDAVKLTIRLSAGYCIILTIAFASSIIFLINKIEKAYGQALVIDRQGEVYEASSLSASDMRQYECVKRCQFLHGGRHGACNYRIVRLRKDNASALSEFSGAPEWRNDYG